MCQSIARARKFQEISGLTGAVGSGVRDDGGGRCARAVLVGAVADAVSEVGDTAVAGSVSSRASRRGSLDGLVDDAVDADVLVMSVDVSGCPRSARWRN